MRCWPVKGLALGVRGYQLLAVFRHLGFASTAAGGCWLADTMGAGKTLVIITTMLENHKLQRARQDIVSRPGNHLPTSAADDAICPSMKDMKNRFGWPKCPCMKSSWGNSMRGWIAPNIMLVPPGSVDQVAKEFLKFMSPEYLLDQSNGDKDAMVVFNGSAANKIRRWDGQLWDAPDQPFLDLMFAHWRGSAADAGALVKAAASRFIVFTTRDAYAGHVWKHVFETGRDWVMGGPASSSDTVCAIRGPTGSAPLVSSVEIREMERAVREEAKARNMKPARPVRAAREFLEKFRQAAFEKMQVPAGCIIVDEAHNVVGKHTVFHKLLRAIRQPPHPLPGELCSPAAVEWKPIVIAMSGTPMRTKAGSMLTWHELIEGTAPIPGGRDQRGRVCRYSTYVPTNDAPVPHPTVDTSWSKPTRGHRQWYAQRMELHQWRADGKLPECLKAVDRAVDNPAYLKDAGGTVENPELDAMNAKIGEVGQYYGTFTTHRDENTVFPGTSANIVPLPHLVKRTVLVPLEGSPCRQAMLDLKLRQRTRAEEMKRAAEEAQARAKHKSRKGCPGKVQLSIMEQRSITAPLHTVYSWPLLAKHAVYECEEEFDFTRESIEGEVLAVGSSVAWFMPDGTNKTFAQQNVAKLIDQSPKFKALAKILTQSVRGASGFEAQHYVDVSGNGRDALRESDRTGEMVAEKLVFMSATPLGSFCLYLALRRTFPKQMIAWLDGAMSTSRRASVQAMFQGYAKAGDEHVVAPKDWPRWIVGTHGVLGESLNLDASRFIIHMEPPMNAGRDRQSNGRAQRSSSIYPAVAALYFVAEDDELSDERRWHDKAESHALITKKVHASERT